MSVHKVTSSRGIGAASAALRQAQEGQGASAEIAGIVAALREAPRGPLRALRGGAYVEDDFGTINEAGEDGTGFTAEGTLWMETTKARCSAA